MKNINKLKDQKKKTEKKQLPKEPPKSIQFNNNEIFSLNDIGSCLSSLVINNCPIFSLTGLKNFESVKTFQAKNALIFSFKNATQIKKLDNISFEGCPIAKYPYYRLMVLLLFGMNENKLKIDSEPVTEEEKALAKNCMNKFSSLSNAESSLVQAYLINGGIIRSLDDLSPDVIKQKMPPNINTPQDSKSCPLGSLSFSPFFTQKSIKNEVHSKSDQIAGISTEKKICDFQNEIRSCQLSLDDIFNRIDLLNSNTPILPLYEHIQKVQKNIECSISEISNIELPQNVSKDIKSANDFLQAINKIDQKYKDTEKYLKNYLIKLSKNCQNAISIISSSKISSFCQDYLDILKKLINIFENITSPQSFSIDFAVSSISQISEINTSFISPYIKIIDKIFDLSKSLLSSTNPSSKGPIITLFQKVSLYKKMPLIHHFNNILEQVAMIQSCIDPNQNSEESKILLEISTLCQDSIDGNILSIYTANLADTNIIIKDIEKCRQSFVLAAISFSKTTNYTCKMPNTEKLDVSILERTKDVGRYIKEFENHINQNKIATTYIKDRVFDCSNGKTHNVYNSSMINLKNEEIRQKNIQIERLKELIAKKKSC